MAKTRDRAYGLWQSAYFDDCLSNAVWLFFVFLLHVAMLSVLIYTSMSKNDEICRLQDADLNTGSSGQAKRAQKLQTGWTACLMLVIEN